MRLPVRVLVVSLVILGILVPLSADPLLLPSAAATHEMARFQSYDEMVSFLKAKPSVCYSPYSPGPVRNFPTNNPTATPDITALTSASGTPSYSTTNVQVQGVDELDTFKTDGHYIYTISNNTLVIVQAYPTSGAKV